MVWMELVEARRVCQVTLHVLASDPCLFSRHVCSYHSRVTEIIKTRLGIVWWHDLTRSQAPSMFCLGLDWLMPSNSGVRVCVCVLGWLLTGVD